MADTAIGIYSFSIIAYERELNSLLIRIGSRAGVEAKLALIFNDIVPELTKQYFPDVIKELRTFSTKSDLIYCTNALTLNFIISF